MASVITTADQNFARACKELELSARISAEAISACVDWHRMDGTDSSAKMVCDSTSLGVAAVAHILRATQLLAIDLEMAAACAVERV